MEGELHSSPDAAVVDEDGGGCGCSGRGGRLTLGAAVDRGADPDVGGGERSDGAGSDDHDGDGGDPVVVVAVAGDGYGNDTSDCAVACW